MPTYKIRRTRVETWEQKLRIEAPHGEAAIDCAEHGAEHGEAPREWRKVSERCETRILEVLKP